MKNFAGTIAVDQTKHVRTLIACPVMRRRWLLALGSLGLLAGSALLAGCGRTITPDQVKALAKRSYPGRDRGELVKASVTALKTLGFEVVVEDAESGIVKTAPKPLVATASGTATTAIAVTNDLAWTIEVATASEGVDVQAIPRASSGGQSYDGPYDADYMEKVIVDLFLEIESNLGPKT
jgi:hypothetical protein